MSKLTATYRNEPAARFAIRFILLFGLLYGGYVFLVGAVAPGNFYSPFLAKYFNAIHWMRWLLLHSTKTTLALMGYHAVYNEYDLLVAGRNLIILNYDCLGFGVMCFFTAFVIAFPKTWSRKLIFLVCGLVTIQMLNVLRLTLLALYWKKTTHFYTDHHFIFNISIYIIMAVSLYFWIKSPNPEQHAAN